MKRSPIRSFKGSFLVYACLGLLLSGAAASQERAKDPVQGVDELYLATTFIEMFSADTKVGSATGFFYQTADRRLFLITNRHVVIKEEDNFFPDRIQLRLHVDPSDLRHSKRFDVVLYDKEKKQKRWKDINPSIDVIAIELAAQDLAAFYIKPVNSTQLMPAGTTIGVGEPLVILGYPLAFFDDVNNLPVARQGAVASAFPIPFRGDPCFLIDAILHVGTSGSPVFIRPGSTSITLSGEPVFGRRPYLIGINSGYYGNLNLNIVWFTSVIEQLVK